MRILHTHKSFSMAQRFVVPLIYEDHRRKDNSELITIDQTSTKVATAFFANRSFNYLGFIWRLVNIISVSKPDIIVAHNSRSSILPLLIARLARIKVRIYFNHGVPHIAYRGISRQVLKFLEALSCKNATHVLTVSKHMQQMLQQMLHPPHLQTQWLILLLVQHFRLIQMLQPLLLVQDLLESYF